MFGEPTKGYRLGDKEMLKYTNAKTAKSIPLELHVVIGLYIVVSVHVKKERGEGLWPIDSRNQQRDTTMNKGLTCITRKSSLIKGTAVDSMKGNISKYARKPRSKEANCFCRCEPGFHMINSHVWGSHASN